MRIKLDENLGRSAIALLTQAGHEADRVTDEGLSGATEETVWRRVCTEGRFFVTLDLDFADVRQYAPGSHPGILLLRPRNTGRSAAIAVLSRVTREHTFDALSGCQVIADENLTRIRRPSN
jgi:predicted nuclease of predicted toxin-antitoxin system